MAEQEIIKKFKKMVRKLESLERRVNRLEYIEQCKQIEAQKELEKKEQNRKEGFEMAKTMLVASAIFFGLVTAAGIIGEILA